jgi:peptide/nickel transport system substrate-binding protein
MQIIRDDLRKLGIDTSVQLMSDAVWYDRASRGQLSAHLQWLNWGDTPYQMYASFMSAASYAPTGADAYALGTNWARYRNQEADRLLGRFRRTTDPGVQHAVIDRIQAIFLRDLPWIPVMYAADWYTYSTLHFTGFPTASNFYADGSPNNDRELVVVLTHLRPTGGSP